MPDETKVFVSWSGDYSKQVALVLRSWLEELFDNVKPFVSDRDIDPGARSMSVIEAELAHTSFGLVVITKENQSAPWLNFEAGALSKVVGDSANRVVPLLMDMDSAAELTGPIAQFQAQKFDQAGLLRIVEGIAAVMQANVEAVKRRFDRSWKEVADQIGNIPASPKLSRERRPLPEMVEETLTIVRMLEKQVASSRLPSDATRSLSASEPTVPTFKMARSAAYEVQQLIKTDGIPGKVSVVEGEDGRLVEVKLFGASDQQVESIHELVGRMRSGLRAMVRIEQLPF